MNKLPRVSIVIPVYNGENFLPTLYERIHNQTYDNIEIIMVDDLSTDNSMNLMKEYQTIDPRVKVIQVEKKCGNAVKAQVQGLPFCTGDYYFYLSQDDFFDYDMIEKCVKKALESDADIILPNMVLYYEGKESTKHGVYPSNGNYSEELDGKEAFLLSLDWKIHGFALRRMRLFEGEEFRAEYYNDDEYYLRCMLLRANKVVFCDSNFYYRQDNPDALTKTIRYFHVDILVTDMMLYEVMSRQNYEKSLIVKRLKDISINWCRYCKRFALIHLDREQRKYVNTQLLYVAKNLAFAWWMLLRNKYGN